MAEADERAQVIAQATFGATSGLIELYAERLATVGVEWGLIGPLEAGRVWERHIFNSAALSAVIGDGASVLDVGSGAGLPGVPLAVLRPDLSIGLVEPMLRRCRFLEETVEALGLADRVRVIRARSEEVSESADAVVARAVAPLGRLIESTAHLFPAGELVALKGDKAEEEIRQAGSVLSRRGLEAVLVMLQADPRCEVARAVRVRRKYGA